MRGSGEGAAGLTPTQTTSSQRCKRARQHASALPSGVENADDNKYVPDHHSSQSSTTARLGLRQARLHGSRKKRAEGSQKGYTAGGVEGSQKGSTGAVGRIAEGLHRRAGKDRRRVTPARRGRIAEGLHRCGGKDRRRATPVGGRFTKGVHCRRCGGRRR